MDSYAGCVSTRHYLAFAYDIKACASAPGRVIFPLPLCTSAGFFAEHATGTQLSNACSSSQGKLYDLLPKAALVSLLQQDIMSNSYVEAD